jgi:DNA-binding CsgD family transcriptional regulator
MGKPRMPKFREETMDLTTQEKTVLILLVQGMRDMNIRTVMDLKPRTLRGYKANIRMKVGSISPDDLKQYGIEQGILPPEQASSKVAGF